MKRWVRALVGDDAGQDLIEYALLALFIGVAALVAWQAIATAIGTSYPSYDSGVQGIWEPPDP